MNALFASYGTMVAHYSVTASAFDPTTGEEVETVVISIVDRALVGPDTLKPNAFKDRQTEQDSLVATIQARHLTVPPVVGDYLVTDSERFLVTKATKNRTKGYYNLAIEQTTSTTPYEKSTEEYLVDWVGDDYSKVVIDELMRAVKYGVFAGTVPDNFLLYAPMGEDIPSILKAMFHPDGIGTSVGNHGFTVDDYITLGSASGLDSGGTKYLDTLWNPSEHVTADSLQLSFNGVRGVAPTAPVVVPVFFSFQDGSEYDFQDENNYAFQGAGLVGEHALLGTSDLSIKPVTGDVQGSVGLLDVLFSDNEPHSYYLEASSSVSLKAYHDGTEVAENVTVQAGTLANESLLAFTDDSINITDANLYCITGGSSLTDAQRLALQLAIDAFNTRLGRL